MIWIWGRVVEGPRASTYWHSLPDLVARKQMKRVSCCYDWLVVSSAAAPAKFSSWRSLVEAPVLSLEVVVLVEKVVVEVVILCNLYS